MPLLSRDKPYKYKYAQLEDPSTAADVIPKKKGNIPRLAVMLGLIEVKYYDVYLGCGAEKTVAQLAEEMNADVADVAMIIDKLAKNGLVTL